MNSSDPSKKQMMNAFYEMKQCLRRALHPAIQNQEYGLVREMKEQIRNAEEIIQSDPRFQDGPHKSVFDHDQMDGFDRTKWRSILPEIE